MKWITDINFKYRTYLAWLPSIILGICAAQAMATTIPQTLLDQIDTSTSLSKLQSEKSTIETETNSVGVLGQGFDTFRELNRAYYLTGQEKEVPSNILADISMDGTYTHERLVQDISRSTTGSFSYSSFSASASSEFSRHTVEDEKSLVFIYKNRFFQPSIKFTNFALNPAGTGQEPFIAGDWVEFRKRCGNRFLEELKIGGGLFYSIKLIFDSLEDKQTVKKSGNASFASFSASGSFEKTIDLTQVSGQIIIRAIQSGGDVTGLGRMMLDSNGGGSDAVVRCNFNDMSACQKFVGNMITYAGSGFPDQFTQPEQIPNVIGYSYLDYATLGAPDVLPPPAGLTNDFINDPVWVKRRALAQEVTELTSQIDRAIALETLYGTKLDPTNQTIVSNIRIEKLEKNYEMLKIAGASCWHYPATCIDTDTNVVY